MVDPRSRHISSLDLYVEAELLNGRDMYYVLKFSIFKPSPVASTDSRLHSELRDLNEKQPW